jgi:bifunctional DNA-binding transcriptional regulator/antitoxin component of YhaV-PrlF toxin-antitoxin module
MSSAVLKADGNIRIPAALRKSVGAEPGQKFDVIAKGSMIVLVPAVDVRSLRGSARGADTSDYREK